VISNELKKIQELTRIDANTAKAFEDTARENSRISSNTVSSFNRDREK
jgi:hypothetical protein